MERGDFDDLPGYGKPIEDLGVEHDPDWWIKKLVEREQIAILPPALALRKDDAELDAPARPDQRRVGGAPRGRGLQRPRPQGDLHAADRTVRAAGDHPAARRRRRGRRVARTAYGPDRGAARRTGGSPRGRAAEAPVVAAPELATRETSVISTDARAAVVCAHDTPRQGLLRPARRRRTRAAARHPGPAEPGDPLLRPGQREDGGQGARHGRHRRRAARQPRGRRQGGEQGEVAPGPGRHRAGPPTSGRPSSGPGSTPSTARGASTTSSPS